MTPEGIVIRDDVDLVEHLLEAEGLAIMDGTSYGAPGRLRISFVSAEETISEGCAAFARGVARLRRPDAGDASHRASEPEL